MHRADNSLDFTARPNGSVRDVARPIRQQQPVFKVLDNQFHRTAATA
jgi:hypothetical protein